MSTTSPDVRTFKGRSLADILDQVRTDLGEDAIVLGRHEERSGGVGGFFAKREIAVQAMAGSTAPAAPVEPQARAGRLDVTDDSPALPDFTELLDNALKAEIEPGAEPTFREALLAGLIEAPMPAPEQPAAEPMVQPVAQHVFETPIVEPVAQAAPAAEAPVIRPEQRSQIEHLARVYDTNADAAQDLVARGLSAALANDVNDEATHLLPVLSERRMQPALRDALARRIPIARVGGPSGPGGAVIGFVGPGGAGKTRCVAVLATAYATRSDRTVACVTLRPKDGGEELRRMLSPHGIPVHAEQDAAAAARLIEELRGHTLVIVDTPSLAARDHDALQALAAELEQLHSDELHVCVPATMALAPGRVLVAAAREVGAGAMAITHADEADELGGPVELAIETGLPISLMGRFGGSTSEDGLHPVAAAELAAALVP